MNLPNKITLARICMIPIFVIVFFLDGILPFAHGIAGLLFALGIILIFWSDELAATLRFLFGVLSILLGGAKILGYFTKTRAK